MWQPFSITAEVLSIEGYVKICFASGDKRSGGSGLGTGVSFAPLAELEIVMV